MDANIRTGSQSEACRPRVSRWRSELANRLSFRVRIRQPGFEVKTSSDGIALNDINIALWSSPQNLNKCERGDAVRRGACALKRKRPRQGRSRAAKA